MKGSKTRWELAKVVSINIARRRVVLEVGEERINLFLPHCTDAYAIKPATHAVYDVWREQLPVFGDIENCLTYIENKSL